MSIQSRQLQNGKSGYKWGTHGKCYADRADAEKQAAAAHANGFVGDDLDDLKKKKVGSNEIT